VRLISAQGRRGGPHPDLCRSLRQVLYLLREGYPRLGLPGLGDYLFSDSSTPVLDAADIAARNMLVTVDDPVAGPRQYARSPIHLSSAAEILASRAPGLGEHTRSVLQGLLGYDESEIEQLEEEGVIEAQ